MDNATTVSVRGRANGLALALATCVIACAFACVAAGTAAAAVGPVLKPAEYNFPTRIAPGGTGKIYLYVDNAGDAATSAPVTVVDTLPAGVTAISAGSFYWNCSGVSTVTCTSKPGYTLAAGAHIGIDGPVIEVKVAPGVTGPLTNRVTVSGGGSPAAALTYPIELGAEPAPFGVADGSFGARATDADGTEYTQAGGHPYEVSTSFLLNNKYRRDGLVRPSEGLENLVLQLPTGLVGNPQALTQCTPDHVATATVTCPSSSQIGVMTVVIGLNEGITRTDVPLYNMVPKDGETAAFATNIGGPMVWASARVREDGDYGITVTTRGITEVAGLLGSTITLWGDPADPRHDPYRFDPRTQTYGAPSSMPRVPFLTGPTDCSAGPPRTTLSVSSYEHRGTTLSYSSAADSPMTGCDRLEFTPSFSLSTDSTRPDSPMGLDVDLGFRQPEGPTQLGTPPLRRASVELPEGVTISPSAADGLIACTDPANCPDASKIGDASAVSPLLADPLTGGIYVAAQQSDDPESGDMFRIFLVLENELRGVHVRLTGHVRLDAHTGRIVTTFDDNPQLPVSKLSLRFKSGPRAVLASPAACGTRAATAQLTSWTALASAPTSSLSFDCTAGLGAFAPTFSAGSASSIAGAFSSFGLHVDRADGQQVVDGVTVQLPPGLLARVKGIPRCAEAQAATGSCSAASRVGSATVGVGPGSAPFYVRDQPVFLTDGYKGGQFGLSVAVRAKAGPFDLGTVVVRQAIHIDPIDAHVTVVSDPLPTIVKGVPLRMRSLDVAVDRPGFMVNPTSCEAKTIGGSLTAPDGRSVPIAQRFQVAGCKRLALAPKLAMSLSGKGQTRDGAHPSLSATLTQPAGGQANLKRVQVTLPLSLALDPDRAKSDDLCSFAEGSKTIPNCPARSVVGRATAVTPILDQPLSGPVYFVKNQRIDAKTRRVKATLPKLAIPLVGQNGVRLTLTATSDVDDEGRLVATFANIPDAAVSSFKLDINGGKKGILVVTGGSKTDICSAAQVAQQQADGQNGKAADADVHVQTPSCPTKVLSKKVGARSVRVKVGGLGAGTVTVTGKGIKKTTRRIAEATVMTLSAARTTGAVGKVTVTFDPAGPAKPRRATAR